MKVFRTSLELIQWRSTLQGSVGFVPTMGNLHKGHISLLAASLKENQYNVVSIFVNPKQFGPKEDFAKYPRTLEQDLALIVEQETLTGKECVVFAPVDNNEIYPAGFQTEIRVNHLREDLEGKIRPGHFDGVTTVVYRLFALVRPTHSYFGKKDYQQWVVLSQMARDLSLSTTVQGLPIIRDNDGLAFSSRNQYLSPTERQQALTLPKTLQKLAEKSLAINSSELRNEMAKIMQQDERWNYLELRDRKTLSHELSGPQAVLLAVYQLGTTRLLDNLEIEINL